MHSSTNALRNCKSQEVPFEKFVTQALTEGVEIHFMASVCVSIKFGLYIVLVFCRLSGTVCLYIIGMYVVCITGYI